jgi:hypothetical protein
VCFVTKKVVNVFVRFFVRRFTNANSNHMKWKGRRQSDNRKTERGECLPVVKHSQVEVVGLIILINVFGGENVQMLTPLLEQINREKARR